MRLNTFKSLLALIFIGVASAYGAATSKTTLVLQGSTSVYYPVYFQDGDWNDGSFMLNIYRSNVHTDSDWAGSMMVQISSHSSCWGNGSEFLEYDVHTRSNAGSMIANIVRTYYVPGVVVWLQGGRTYYYDSNHSTQVQQNSSGGAELVLYENAQYSVHEGFTTKTAVDKDFETAGRTIGNDVTIGGNLGVGTSNPTAKVEVAGSVFINREQSGFVADAAGLRRVGLMKYPGIEGAIVHSGGIPFRFGRVSTADVTQGTLETFTEEARFDGNGNFGIGTTSPTEKLSVNGKIRAKEVIVETTGWSDYVFAKDYKLASLSEVEQHIEQQGHLPGVPSAQEVAEKGVSVGDMQAILLAKIEELTLHQIAQEKRIQALETENAQLKAQAK